MKRYFQTDPTYKARFSDVWLWNEWPYSKGHDVGIDIVRSALLTVWFLF